MSRGSRTTFAAALLALAAPGAALAAPTKLPTVQEAVSAAATSRTACATGLRSGASADRAAYTAPASGYLTVRTAGRGDWDLTLHDAASRRTLATSQSFGAREVAQAWVTAGQRVLAQACRRPGASRTATVSFTLLQTTLPKGASTASLVEVKYDDFSTLDLVEALGGDVTHQHAGGVADVIVDQAVLGKLRKAGLDLDVEIADLGEHYAKSRRADKRFNAAVNGKSPLPSGRTGYRTYADYGAELKKLVDENKGLAKPFTMTKKSVQGRAIEGIELSSDVDAEDDGKPTFLLTGVHHAREWPSSEAAMEFAYMLVQGAKSDPRIKALLRKQRFVIVPLINPDGFIASRGAPVSAGDATGQPLVQTAEAIAPPGGTLAYRRKNCGSALAAANPALAALTPCDLQYGIDPNRNYGNGWGGNGAGSDVNTQSYRGPSPWSEPETQAVHELGQRRALTGFITLHTVGAMVLRPPGRSKDGKAPDENLLKAVGDAMGEATGWESKYSFQLYDTSGTAEDWNYAAAGTLGYTIEIGPKNGQFHMPYETGVVRQWVGEPGKGGLREALLVGAEAAADEATHSVLVGEAPAGTTLRLHKDFITETAPVCTYAQGYLNSTGIPPAASGANCLAPGAVQPAMKIPDFLDYTTQVGEDGEFTWHVTQSTRPFVGGRYLESDDEDVPGQAVDTGVREQYTLTCLDADGKPFGGERKVQVDRGQELDLGEVCGA